MNPVFDQLSSIFPYSKEKLIRYADLYQQIEVPAKTILLAEGKISNSLSA